MTEIAHLELRRDHPCRRGQAAKSDRAGNCRGAAQGGCDGVQRCFNAGVCQNGSCNLG
jgi:hypothetical protein